MGARVYLPTLGRFASVDPIQGGTPNSYVYPTDPVGEQDLTGNVAYVKDSLDAYHAVCGHGWWQLTCIPIGSAMGKGIELAVKAMPKAVNVVKSVRIVVESHPAHHFWVEEGQKVWRNHIEIRVWRQGVKAPPIFRKAIPYGKRYLRKWGK